MCVCVCVLEEMRRSVEKTVRLLTEALETAKRESHNECATYRSETDFQSKVVLEGFRVDNGQFT